MISIKLSRTNSIPCFTGNMFNVSLVQNHIWAVEGDQSKSNLWLVNIFWQTWAVASSVRKLTTLHALYSGIKITANGLVCARMVRGLFQFKVQQIEKPCWNAQFWAVCDIGLKCFYAFLGSAAGDLDFGLSFDSYYKFLLKWLQSWSIQLLEYQIWVGGGLIINKLPPPH